MPRLIDPRDIPKRDHIDLTDDEDRGDDTEHEPEPETTRHRPGEEPRTPDAPDSSDEDTLEEVNVWPTHTAAEELRDGDVEESGLSVDPEDLGRQWLNQATEQNNFESTEPEDTNGIHVIHVPFKTES